MNKDQSVASALAELETDYWFDVDHHWGRTAHEFHAENGVFAIDGKRMAGREAVRKFYDWRESRGLRTARHVISNLRVRCADENHATLQCIMCLYAADGAPVLESKPAIMIADVVAEWVLDSDGAWRYVLHELKSVFLGGEAPTIPPDE